MLGTRDHRKKKILVINLSKITNCTFFIIEFWIYKNILHYVLKIKIFLNRIQKSCKNYYK